MARSLKLLVICWLVVAQILLGSQLATAGSLAPLNFEPAPNEFLYAQFEGNPAASSRVDVDPPLIEHDVDWSTDADIRQTFMATVVDDSELDTVMFFYRFAGETNFTRSLMSPLSFSSTYIAQIPTDPNQTTAIEYYIEARDVSGYAFNPLVREIEPVKADASTAATTSETEAAESVSRGLPKVVYVVGGVLLLGLLAGLSSGGGDDGGGGGAGPTPAIGEPCSGLGCLLTITANRPL